MNVLFSFTEHPKKVAMHFNIWTVRNGQYKLLVVSKIKQELIL